MFNDRFDAGRQLALQLSQYKDTKEVIVIAIPRGGLEVGYEIAKELHAPLDILLTKKIGAPQEPEVAIGSVSLEHELIDDRFAPLLDYYKDYIAQEIRKIRAQLIQRYKQYRSDKSPLSVKDKIVILTDDGVATGHTLLAAIALLRKDNPKKIVVAIPVAPLDTAKKIKSLADEFVCLIIPTTFYGVSQFYHDFSQVEDEEAIQILAKAQR